MNKDDQIKELTALLYQERAYAYTLKAEIAELKALQSHLISGLETWKSGFDHLFHQHHVATGSAVSSACSLCLARNQFELSELVPALLT